MDTTITESIIYTAEQNLKKQLSAAKLAMNEVEDKIELSDDDCDRWAQAMADIKDCNTALKLLTQLRDYIDLMS